MMRFLVAMSAMCLGLTVFALATHHWVQALVFAITGTSFAINAHTEKIYARIDERRRAMDGLS